MKLFGLAVVEGLANVTEEAGRDSEIYRESREVLCVRVGLGIVRVVELAEIKHEAVYENGRL